ncbi:GNAT family N-acetyltransferase [Spongiimicrobium sp. 2-473A-2-J]|uniref:GNAT family N-acetyltransferase n=1 Tax=Eudoraea algarum TaxID=3417568 RepID=UPI003D367650
MRLLNKLYTRFFTLLFRSGDIYDYYARLEYFDQYCESTAGHSPMDPQLRKSVYSIRLVPDYFKLALKDSSLRTKTISHYNWGYAIQMKGENIDHYLEQQFKSKYRSIIRRYVNRLEACFPIQYKLFHGTISSEEYRFIMETLHAMIVRRFGQRKETHKELYQWNLILRDTYEQILAKKASLFVIYDGNKPIEVSLNYHFERILFSALSSYDIDYSKFGLGHVEIYKQVQWCIANDYLLFEMGVGGMDYKRRWCNLVYAYEHHVMYHQDSISSLLYGQLEIFRVRIKEYLKSKKVNEMGYRLGIVLQNIFPGKGPVGPQYELHKVEDIEAYTDKVAVSINEPGIPLKKKMVYDFLYSHTENIGNVSLFRLGNQPGVFLISGQKNHARVVFPEPG